MTEELKGRLEQLAYWHFMTTLSAPSDRKDFHSNAAADIRAAIVIADSAFLVVRGLTNAYEAQPGAITDPGSWHSHAAHFLKMSEGNKS